MSNNPMKKQRNKSPVGKPLQDFVNDQNKNMARVRMREVIKEFNNVMDHAATVPLIVKLRIENNRLAADIEGEDNE